MLQSIKLNLNYSDVSGDILKELKQTVNKSYICYGILKMLAVKIKLKKKEKLKGYLNGFYSIDKGNISNFMLNLREKMRSVFNYQRKFLEYKGINRKNHKYMLLHKNYLNYIPNVNNVSLRTLRSCGKIILDYLRAMNFNKRKVSEERKRRGNKCVAFKVMSNVNPSLSIKYLIENSLLVNFKEISLTLSNRKELFLSKNDIYNISSILHNIEIDSYKNGLLILGPPYEYFVKENKYKICFNLKETTVRNKEEIFYDKLRFKNEELINGIDTMTFQIFNIELSKSDIPNLADYAYDDFYLKISGGNYMTDFYKTKIIKPSYIKSDSIILEFNYQISVSSNFFYNEKTSVVFSLVRIPRKNLSDAELTDNVILDYLTKVEVFSLEYNINDIKINKSHILTPKSFCRSKLFMNAIPFFIDEAAAAKCGCKYLDEGDFDIKTFPYESFNLFIGNKFYLITQLT